MAERLGTALGFEVFESRGVLRRPRPQVRLGREPLGLLLLDVLDVGIVAVLVLSGATGPTGGKAGGKLGGMDGGRTSGTPQYRGVGVIGRRGVTVILVVSGLGDASALGGVVVAQTR
jgi:hypothetical protein